MSTEAEDLNRKVAQKLNEEATKDSTSPYARKFVGISNGQVVAVADNLDKLVEKLRLLSADPAQTLCLEAGLDYSTVQEIWSSC